MFNLFSAIANLFDTPENLSDYLPPLPPELDEGYTVTVHGDLSAYPAVVLEILTVDRVRVQYWDAGNRAWYKAVVDYDRCEWAEHEIGACLSCGTWDWYNTFDDDCQCADCQPAQDSDYYAPEDTYAEWRSDWYEDDIKSQYRAYQDGRL